MVPNEYRMTIVRTEDGRILTGLLVRETDEVVELRTEYESIVVPRAEVDVMRLDASSMMPEGQLDALAEEDALALVAYLMHDAQVPLPLTAETTERFFAGESSRAGRATRSCGASKAARSWLGPRRTCRATRSSRANTCWATSA